MKVCSITGCEEPHRARGWCNLHYGRWWRTGDPLTEPQHEPTGARRRVSTRRSLSDYPTPTPQATPCRLWQGPIDRYGYGKRPDRELVHQWVWRTANGPIPDGMEVMHHCDQPLCYRLDHLYLGTHADNMRAMKERGRSRNQFTKEGGKGHESS